MKCPDLDRLIDVSNEDTLDGDIERHLETCSSCRANLELLREIREALDPDIEVTDHLIDRVVDDLFGANARPKVSSGTSPEVRADPETDGGPDGRYGVRPEASSLARSDTRTETGPAALPDAESEGRAETRSGAGKKARPGAPLRESVTLTQVAASGLLGFATTGLTVLVGGATAGGGFSALLLFSGGVGVASAAIQWYWSRPGHEVKEMVGP